MTSPRPSLAAVGPCAAIALFLLAPVSGAGQSLLSGGGLGMQSDPLDARSRVMGGVGLGLPGWHLSLNDPAAAAGVPLPSMQATMQPTSVSPEGEAEGGGTRFPQIGVSYPFGRHVFSIHFGSFLDQEWEVRSERQIQLRGEPVEVRDRYVSGGGIGQVRLGWATRIGEDLALGASAGSYVGSMSREFSRDLNPSDVGEGVELYRSSARWRASGPVASIGVSWDPSDLLRLSTAAEWAGDLSLDPVEGSEGAARSYPMALTLRGGGSFTLAPGVLLTLGASRADWSGTDSALAGGEARSTAWGYGAGLQWGRAALLDRAFPLRVGYMQRQLPFHFEGEAASESAFSAGFGLHLADQQDVPMARIEMSLERGSRSAGALSEDFLRGSISLRLSGG